MQTAILIGSNIYNHALYTISEFSEVGYFAGEDIPMAQKRAITKFDSIMSEWGDFRKKISPPPDINIVIVSHGGIIQGIAIHLGHPDGICDRGKMLEMSL